MRHIQDEVPILKYFQGVDNITKRKMTDGLAPILCKAGSNAIHHHFFGCPRCGTEVGGFVITGSGEDDWSTHEDKFCKECGQKIDWSNTEFSSIYKF